MEKVVKFEDFIVKFDDSQEIKHKVFEKVLEFYIKNEAFEGEVISQDDDCIITAHEYFSEIADEIIKFKVAYTD